ncbi:MAG: bacterio-opsin activator domain-containing protein [Halovenus sp.]
MTQRDALARLTLDTLPFNIAVLDEEGVIRFTNESWREYSGSGEEGEMVGVDYFASTDPSADEYAADALDGIRAVIDGEQEVFTLEYPCHTPTEKQWFLMRAARLPDHDAGRVVVAHIDITQRKLAELEARRQRQELEHLMTRIDGLVGTVMEAALQAQSREEIERQLCDRLVDVEPYVSAWVGRLDLREEVVRPAAGAGDGAPADGALPRDADDPTAAALRAGEPQVVRNTSEGSLAPLHDPALAAAAAADVGDPRAPADGVGTTAGTGGAVSAPADTSTAAGGTTDRREASGGELAAFPLVYSDTEYGVLTVYAGTADVLDERELAVLQEVARVASTAINAIEGRRILTSDRVTEVELALSDEGLFFADIARALNCSFQYEGAIYDDDAVTMLFVVRGADPEAVTARVQAHDDVTAVTRVSDGDDGSVFEFEVERPPVVSNLAQRGAETTDITAHGSDVRITLELPASADPRRVIEQLAERYPSTELVARRERERPGQTRQELVADIEQQLTDRQRLALRKAAIGGFFDWPRGVSGEELATSMDISPSTYHQHLRSAEKKIIETLLEVS